MTGMPRVLAVRASPMTAFLNSTGLWSRTHSARPSWWSMSKAFLRYRRGGDDKRSPMPDFYIGAHAAVAGYRLLTRDVRRYRTYFPTIDIIAPVPVEDVTAE